MTEQAPQSTEPSQPEQYTLRTRSTRHVLATAPSDTGITAVTWGPASEEPAIAPPLPSIPSFSTLEDALPQEFSVIGTRHVRVADLLVHHADGTAASLVRLDGAPELSRGDDGDVLRATLLEDVGDLRIDLTWRTSPHHDVITREAVLTNIGDAPLTLVRARTGSFGVHLPGGADVTTLTGEWCEEFGPTTTRLRCGTFSLSSRQGITSHRDSPVLTLADPTDPARGCWSVQLAWSGSWQAEVDMTDTGGWARIAAGACDLENQVTLRPGERYEAPALLGLWAPDSDAAARAWHCFARLDLLRDTSA